MFFRRLNPPTRADHWRQLAERLELIESGEVVQKIRDLLNLEGNATFGPIYMLELDASRRLYLFDYHEGRSGPSGNVSQTTSVCLMRLREPFMTLSLKASRKLNRVLESLGASASGGQTVTVPDDPAFNEQVTVFARDPEAARALLVPPLRELLVKTLCTREAKPTFLLGERHLLLSNRAPSDEPTSMAVIEELLTDLLSLYTALTITPQDEQA